MVEVNPGRIGFRRLKSFHWLLSWRPTEVGNCGPKVFKLGGDLIWGELCLGKARGRVFKGIFRAYLFKGPYLGGN